MATENEVDDMAATILSDKPESHDLPYMRREECLTRHEALHGSLDDIKGQLKIVLGLLVTIFVGLFIKFIAS